MSMTINSQQVLYGPGRNDECKTPGYAVSPILSYIPIDWTVWCPFDTEDSEYVRQLRDRGSVVIASHIDNGQDFYKWQPNQQWDVIVSNPPFTRKRQIFERTLRFGKPFALLMSLTWLNDKYSKWVFFEAKRNMQLLMFDRRVHFETAGSVRKKTTFSSGYYCSDLLPKDIMLMSLPK